jgi:hypothetical protein
MKNFQDVSLSTALRFGLTGFVALALFAFAPIAIFTPSALKNLSEFGTAVGIITCSFALGFVIDGLKLYQLSVGYKKRRAQFSNSVAKVLQVDSDAGPTYFVKAAQLERELGLGHIDFLHSRWVAFDVCARIILGAGILWGTTAVVLWAERRADVRVLGFLLGVAITCVGSALRLLHTARQEQVRVAMSYLDFCRRHRELILSPDLVQAASAITALAKRKDAA